MKILLDTNILIDYISKREPYTEHAKAVLMLCMENKIEGCIAAHSVMNTFYILRKEMSVSERRNYLINVCSFLTVIGIDKNKIIASLNNNDFSDFEDCLQSECAKAFSSDYIVTRNIKDFTDSLVPAILPDEFLKLISL